MKIRCQWLDFYRTDFSFTGQQKVYLIVVFARWCRPRVVIQLIPSSCQYLRHRVLIDVAHISFQFVTQQFLINDILCKFIVPESESDKQPCISTEQFELVAVDVWCQSCTWVVSMISYIDGRNKNAEILKRLLLKYAEILKELNPVYAENLNMY